jgi:hypothetical protein
MGGFMEKGGFMEMLLEWNQESHGALFMMK